MKIGLLFFGILISAMVGCSTPFVNQPAERKGITLAAGQTITAVPDAKSAIQISLRDGPAVAALLNRNYNQLGTECVQRGSKKVRGYYFCTGVLLRSVDNGNFNPWSVSPTADALWGMSFSWVRHDVGVHNLYHSAGFVVLNPADILGLVIPEIRTGMDETKCVYPFDAWTTRTMDRQYSGCDDEGTGIGWPTEDMAWGSCDQRYRYSSSTQWDAHFRNANQINYKQCSWNADNPQGWRNMIASRRNFPSEQSWNEVMVSVSTRDEEVLRAWTTAFFYDPARANGLSDSKAFQRKMDNTGKWVPILRLLFSAPSTSRFQYFAADQAIAP
ncbi:hypothetical protein [Pseudomonas quasicaspiana]|uniref:hypothetical protein n=1 Tax=Pseudomonas quasicaspiana TaxID=2829821 RepID=UPI001E608293|nr:hypothetical protein [Pseudomonas quasicaspiana]MCD5970327.1 hypothetical protein [Pseudomonas quasicaspiana]